MLRLRFTPEPVLIYKPNSSQSGTALKVQLRIEPKFGDGFITHYNGGAFLEMVPQGPSENEYPAFKWKDDDARVVSKIGVQDISAMLMAYRNMRITKMPILKRYRTKNDEAGNSLSLFHKFGEIATFIEWTFTTEGSFLRIGKTNGRAAKISLTLPEEIQIVNYLQHALTMFQLVGGR